MKTIFIRFKSVCVLGLMCLSVSFIWFVLNSHYQTQIALLEEKVISEMPTKTEPVLETGITIVSQEPEQTTRDFFSEYRLERERMRSEQLEILHQIINNPHSDTESKAEAQEKLLWLSGSLGKEVKIEKALQAKGFHDVAVAVETEVIMVIIPTEGLRQDEIAKIADIVIKIAECDLEDVVIVPTEI